MLITLSNLQCASEVLGRSLGGDGVRAASKLNGQRGLSPAMGSPVANAEMGFSSGNDVLSGGAGALLLPFGDLTSQIL